MILGPEFQRHLWTRFTPFSLMLMPIVVGVIGVICFLIGVTGQQASGFLYGSRDAGMLWSTMGMFVSMPVLFISLLFVGSHAAANSFTDEISNKTWDLQKMSSIRPIELVLGKVLGVTSYVWYMSSGFLLLFLYGYMHASDRLGNTPSFYDGVLLLFTILSSALTAHIIAAFGSALKMNKKKVKSSGSMVMGIVAGIFCFNTLMTVFSVMHYESFASDVSIGRTIEWFGADIPKDAFAVYSWLFFLGWALIGLHRIVRSELNFQHYPFVWITFLTTLSLYLTGLYAHRIDNAMIENGSGIVLLIPAFLIFLMATYSGMYSVASDVSLYQRFIVSLQAGRRKRALESLPDWVLTLLVSFGLALVMSVIVAGSEVKSVRGVEVDTHAATMSLLFSMILFTIRDGIVVHICFMRDQFKRGGVALVAYYAFAYFLLPQLLFNLDGVNWSADQALRFYADDYPRRWSMGVFYPMWQEDMMAALLPVTVQIAGFGYLLRKMMLKQIGGSEDGQN